MPFLLSYHATHASDRDHAVRKRARTQHGRARHKAHPGNDGYGIRSFLRNGWWCVASEQSVTDRDRGRLGAVAHSQLSQDVGDVILADRGMMGGSGHGVNAGMALVDGVDHTELSTQQ